MQQTPLIEVNEMGPTIQQGVIQCPVQRGTQLTGKGARPKETACQRIQDFPQGGAPTPKIAIIFQFFAENCMKMKEL